MGIDDALTFAVPGMHGHQPQAVLLKSNLIINTMQNPHLMPPIHLHNEHDDDQISFDTAQFWSVCFTLLNSTAV
jgi:hypothetical protein